MQGGTIINGDGVLLKTGAGILALEEYNGTSVSIQMTGGTIDIEQGSLRSGANWDGGIDWTQNKASLTIGPNGWLNMWRGGPIYVDALNGSGQFNCDDGYGTNVYLIIGVNDGSGTWSGTISDESNTMYVTKNGSGTETFNSPNSYHGDTTINNGVLKVADPNALQNSTVVVNVNNGLVFANGIGTANLGGLSGPGNVSLTTSDPDPVTISVGSNNNNTTYSGSLSGSGGLTKVGYGTLTLSASHSYLGATTINNGTLALAPGFSATTTVSYAYAVAVSNSSFETPVIGPGGWTKAPGYADNQALASADGWNFSGAAGIATNGCPFMSANAPDGVQAGLFQYNGIGDPSNGVMSQVVTVSTAGTYLVGFQESARWNADNEVEVQFDGTTLGTVYTGIGGTWAQQFTPAFLATTGTHTLTFIAAGDSPDIDMVTMSSAPIYTTTYTLSPTNNMLPTTTPVIIDKTGRLDLAGNNQQVASLSDGANGGGQVVNSGSICVTSTLTLSPTDGATSTFSGGIVGAIKLVMTGTGTQVLAGTNTYTGGTEASSGTLDFAGPDATPSEGILTVDPGGYVVLGALVQASLPTATSEESAEESTATTATTSTTTAITSTAKTEASGIVVGGGAAGAVGGHAAAVPEPSTVVLLLAGVAGLAIATWRRRRATL